MKILIGTVPYGCDNIGDEAIAATIVAAVRGAVPDAEITLSTNDQEHTGKKLNVRTVPLFGHLRFPWDKNEMKKEMQQADYYIWGGATGLSDYPEFALDLVEAANQAGTGVILYGCGMNTRLNPAFYNLMPGKRKTILDMMSFCTLKAVDFAGSHEKKKVQATLARMKKELSPAKLIICRDSSSAHELKKSGLENKIHVNADPAILLEPSAETRQQQLWKEQNLWEDDKPIVGICISAQRAVKQLDDIARLADELTETRNCHILFIPMNPITDAELMARVLQKMKNCNDARLLKDVIEPEDITSLTSRLSLVISSRLHLLILSSILHTPLVGLSRGTKIDNFMALFGEKSCGSVEEFNLQYLKENCIRLLENGDEFREKSRQVMNEYREKASGSIELLKEVLK